MGSRTNFREVLISIHFIREKERIGNNEIRVAGIDYSHEKYIKTHFYRQFTSDQNTYDFIVDSTSQTSFQQFMYINAIF